MTTAYLRGSRTRLRSLIRSSAAGVLAVSLSITAAGFVTSLILNRGLGPTGRGQLAAALVIAGLLPYIASTGLGTAVLYYSGPRSEGGPLTLATALPIGILQSAVAGIAAFLLLPLLLGNQGPSVVESARIALWSLPANLLVLYIASAYQSHLQFSMFNFLRALVPLGALIGAAALAWTDTLTARHMVLIYTALPFLALGLGVIAARRSNLLNRLSPTRTMASRLLRYGMKAFVGELSNSVNIRLDQVLIAVFLPARQLGLYVTAISASQLAVMVSFSIRTVLQPRLIDEQDHAAKWRLFKRGMWQYTVIGGGISVVLALIVPIAIPWLFGNAFRAAILPTEILIWAVFILGHKTILTGVAQAYGDPWLASRAELVGAVVTIVTLLALVPSLGITGAGLSSLIAYSTQAAIILHGLRTIHAPSSTTPGSILR